MPSSKEVTAEHDSLDSRLTAADEEAIAPHQFQSFKKPEYDSLHLSPGKSVLKVLWERVSAEIAQRSGHTMQAGIKGSVTVKKTWAPPTTHYDDSPISRQQLSSTEEKPAADVVWDHVSTVIAPTIVANMKAMNKEEREPEQLLTEIDHDLSPSLVARQSAQAVLDRVTTVIDCKNVANSQVDYTSYVGSREEHPAVQAEKERNNLSLATSTPDHQRQLVASREKPQGLATEDTISSKTQDSTNDYAPTGEQEDQYSVEENVTTYDAPAKEQLEEDPEPKVLSKKRTPTFGTKVIPARFTDYLEERTVFKEEMEGSLYSPLVMDSQQTELPREEIQEDMKPRHVLHEDVPKSATVEAVSLSSDPETKRDDGEEEEEERVPYLPYNPEEAVQKDQVQETAPETPDRQEPSRDDKIEALRKELEAIGGYDEDEDTCLYEEDLLSLKPPSVRDGVGANTYVMPDPVRARLDDEVLLYHMPRSPEAPRRFSDKVFFRFK